MPGFGMPPPFMFPPPFMMPPFMFGKLSGFICSMKYDAIAFIWEEFWLVLPYDLMDSRPIDDVTIEIIFIFIIQCKFIDLMLPMLCSVMDHRRHQKSFNH